MIENSGNLGVWSCLSFQNGTLMTVNENTWLISTIFLIFILYFISIGINHIFSVKVIKLYFVYD